MAILYVDAKNGNDAGDGSSGSPLKTLAHCLASHAQNGDTIFLRGSNAVDEIYHERGLSTSLTSLIIAADAGHTPVLSAADQFTSWAKTAGRTKVYEATYTPGNCWSVWNGSTRLASADGVASCDGADNSYYFDNAGDKLYVNIGGTAPSAIEVVTENTFLLTLAGAGATVRGLTFQWAMQAVVYPSGGTATISGCTFQCQQPFAFDNAMFAWVYLPTSGNVVSNCTFVGAYGAGTGTNNIGIGAAADNNTVENSTFSGGYYGVTVDGGSHAVNDCVFTGLANSGVSVGGGTVTVQRCVATDNGHNGFSSVGAGTLNAYHCVVNYTSDVAAPITGALYGFVIHGNATLYHCVAANLKRTTKLALAAYNAATTGVVVIKNCIAYNCGAGIADSSDTTPPAGGWDADYNCINGCTTAYGTGYSAGAHDLSSDPAFVNTTVGSDDFHLTSSSPCLNAGVAVEGVNDGYKGTAPDIGAYELAPRRRHRFPRRLYL